MTSDAEATLAIAEFRPDVVLTEGALLRHLNASR